LILESGYDLRNCEELQIRDFTSGMYKKNLFDTGTICRLTTRFGFACPEAHVLVVRTGPCAWSNDPPYEVNTESRQLLVEQTPSNRGAHNSEIKLYIK
jgi:hypothetical protein